MTERLTKTIDCCIGMCYECSNNKNHECSMSECEHFSKILDKLAQFEDLQEQDRLIILPGNFDKEKFVNFMSVKYCPSYFGFKDKNRLDERCVYGNECKECWEAALKGE